MSMTTLVAMMLVVLMMSFFSTHVISFKRCRSLAHDTWADA
jgi:hypothetical protein